MNGVGPGNCGGLRLESYGALSVARVFRSEMLQNWYDASPTGDNIP